MNEGIKELVEGVARIEQKLDTTHDWVKSHESRIVSMEADINKAKGGWLAVIGLSGFAGAVGGFVHKIATKISP